MTEISGQRQTKHFSGSYCGFKQDEYYVCRQKLRNITAFKSHAYVKGSSSCQYLWYPYRYTCIVWYLNSNFFLIETNGESNDEVESISKVVAVA